LSRDKVLLEIDFAMQYQYSPSVLKTVILKQFGSGKQYNKFIYKRALSSIMDTCLKHDAEEYYTSRGLIGIQMYDELVLNINNQSVGTIVEFFQLINIDFPDSFSDVITSKQNIQQQALTSLNDRQSILTNAQTALYEAQRTASITLINANNTAMININKAKTQSDAQIELWNQRTYGYAHAMNILGLNATDMIDYIESENIKKSSILVTSA
jgi:regulator of protease activity HflC (stomatin/prohibitin superfamily)